MGIETADSPNWSTWAYERTVAIQVIAAAAARDDYDTALATIRAQQREMNEAAHHIVRGVRARHPKVSWAMIARPLGIQRNNAYSIFTHHLVPRWKQ